MHPLRRTSLEDFLIQHGFGQRDEIGNFMRTVGLASPPTATPTYSAAEGPLVVSSGQTISGRKFVATGAACITVNTSSPVIIEDCWLEGKDWDCLVRGNNANVTIRRCKAVGLAPTTANGYTRPHLLKSGSPVHIQVDNCDLDHTCGVLVKFFTGNGSPTQTILVRNNKVRNIDGREFGDTSKQNRSFVSLDALHVGNMQIAWNEVINTQGESSVDDVLNFFNAGGTAAAPAEVHHNFIWGSYALTPALDHSGSGMIMDGDDLTFAGTCSYVNAHDNYFIGTSNAGMNVSVGHHFNYLNNVIINSALSSTGVPQRGPYAGMSHFNYKGQDAAWFGQGTTISGNQVAYMINAASGGGRKDFDLGGLAATNTSLNPGQAVTYAQEQAQLTAFLQAKVTAGVVIGIS